MNDDNVVPITDALGVNKVIENLKGESGDIECIVVGILYKDKTHGVSYSSISAGQMAFITKIIDREFYRTFID